MHARTMQKAREKLIVGKGRFIVLLESLRLSCGDNQIERFPAVVH